MTRETGWDDAAREREHALLAEFATLSDDDPRRSAIRDELTTSHLPLVQHLAGRYRDRGEPMDDLVQAGTIGLILAIDRFDPDRGTELSTYATPTILGEIRRHFRDRAWAIRVPRGLQDLQRRVSTTMDDLTAQLHRSPTVREVAEALGVGTDDVLAALEARQAYATETLDVDPETGAGPVADLGEIEPAFTDIDERETLLPLLAALPDREREIIRLRFVEGQSQTQIAQRLGISQMQVSRLLGRTLSELRDGMTRD